MSHKILIGAAVLAVAVLGYAWVSMNQPTASTPVDITQTNTPATSTTTTGSTATGTTSTTPPGSYTMANVAAHNNASSCWAAINGKVYNLTSWIKQHPGGQAAILSLCGTDGSAAFNGQHGGQPRPASELAGFLLGPLAQ